MASLAWGGFENGKIPQEHLRQFEGTGKYLQADAAASLSTIFDEVEAETGRRPYIATGQDLYRDYDEQVRLLKHNYRVVASGGSLRWGGQQWAKKSGIDPTTGRAFVSVATPGSSNHGWARAGDISFPTTASRAAFRRRCVAHGWTNAGDAFGEDWHKEYHGPITTTAGGDYTPIEEFPMKIDILKIRNTDDGSNPNQYRVFASTPTGGIRAVRDPYRLELIRRYNANDPADIMFPAEFEIINTEFLWPPTVALQAVDVQALATELAPLLGDSGVTAEELTAKVAAALQPQFDAVQANIDDQPTEFTVTPRA